MTKRVAVVGAGGMARVRTKALLATGKAEICGVAARRLASAQKFGAEIGCRHCVDDYRCLLDTRPDAVLVEVPHTVQDEVVLWALKSGLHVLIGGSLATQSAVAEQIRSLAEGNDLVVEAGYQARYMALWETARSLVQEGRIGQMVAVRGIALWAGDPASWYYSQSVSGGMPLTHMTYCFINPIRWIMGDPVLVSAFANRKWQTAPDMIAEETCVANLLFPDGVLCTLTAGFVKPAAMSAWSATFLGTAGALDLAPTDMESGSMTAFFGAEAKPIDFASSRDGFEAQADAFLAALDGKAACRNTPRDTVGDILLAEAIVTSAREKRTVTL